MMPAPIPSTPPAVSPGPLKPSSEAVTNGTKLNGTHTTVFDRLEDALHAFANGEFLLVMDDERRENEGDLMIAASQITTQKMAFMIKHTRLIAIGLPIIKWLTTVATVGTYVSRYLKRDWRNSKFP
jgi:hypothetical protein